MKEEFSKEKKIFFFLCLYHLILWTLVCSISNKNLPLDVIEALAWGRDFEWGYIKHPPLSAWIPGLLFKLFGNIDWIYYFLSQLFIVISLIFVWNIAAFIFKKDIFKLISVLSLETIVFYNFETPQFNVNICQLPLWSGSIYFFFRCLLKNKIVDWLFLGVFCALGFLTKYIFVYLIISFIIIFLIISIREKKINNYSFLSLSIFLLIIYAHLQWLINNDFITLIYAAKRGGLTNYSPINHLINPLIFISKQLVILSPFFLSFFIIFKKKSIKLDLYNKKFFLLIILTLSPVILILFTSVISGSVIRTVWMIPFYSTLGIFFTYVLFKGINITKLKFFKMIIIFFLILSPVAYSIRSINFDSRTGYEGERISKTVLEEWKKYTSNSIENVGFSEWYAGNLSYHLNSRPKVFLKETEDFYKSNSVIIDKNPIEYCKKNINNKKIVYLKMYEHNVCFIFKT